MHPFKIRQLPVFSGTQRGIARITKAPSFKIHQLPLFSYLAKIQIPVQSLPLSTTSFSPYSIRSRFPICGCFHKHNPLKNIRLLCRRSSSVVITFPSIPELCCRENMTSNDIWIRYSGSMSQDVGRIEGEVSVADCAMSPEKFIWHALTRVVGNVKKSRLRVD